jgi:hypothetical protein
MTGLTLIQIDHTKDWQITGKFLSLLAISDFSRSRSTHIENIPQVGARDSLH